VLGVWRTDGFSRRRGNPPLAEHHPHIGVASRSWIVLAPLAAGTSRASRSDVTEGMRAQSVPADGLALA